MATARSINNDAPAAQKEPWAWNHHDQCGFNGVPCRRWCAGWWSGCGWEKRGQRVSRGTEEEKPGGPPGHRRPTQQRAWLGCEQYRSSLFQSAFIRPPHTHTQQLTLQFCVFSLSELTILFFWCMSCSSPNGSSWPLILLLTATFPSSWIWKKKIMKCRLGEINMCWVQKHKRDVQKCDLIYESSQSPVGSSCLHINQRMINQHGLGCPQFYHWLTNCGPE